jgi:hypothetical protein
MVKPNRLDTHMLLSRRQTIPAQQSASRWFGLLLVVLLYSQMYREFELTDLRHTVCGFPLHSWETQNIAQKVALFALRAPQRGGISGFGANPLPAK